MEAHLDFCVCSRIPDLELSPRHYSTTEQWDFNFVFTCSRVAGPGLYYWGASYRHVLDEYPLRNCRNRVAKPFLELGASHRGERITPLPRCPYWGIRF